jgi:hypothetical protein
LEGRRAGKGGERTGARERAHTQRGGSRISDCRPREAQRTITQAALHACVSPGLLRPTRSPLYAANLSARGMPNFRVFSFLSMPLYCPARPSCLRRTLKLHPDSPPELRVRKVCTKMVVGLPLHPDSSSSRPQDPRNLPRETAAAAAAAAAAQCRVPHEG